MKELRINAQMVGMRLRAIARIPTQAPQYAKMAK
jgi:hypothetical protein